MHSGVMKQNKEISSHSVRKFRLTHRVTYYSDMVHVIIITTSRCEMCSQSCLILVRNTMEYLTIGL